MVYILYFVLFVIISGLIMTGTNILFDLFSAVIPVVAVVLIIVGVIVGLTVAVRNTAEVYSRIYGKKR